VWYSYRIISLTVSTGLVRCGFWSNVFENVFETYMSTGRANGHVTTDLVGVVHEAPVELQQSQAGQHRSPLAGGPEGQQQPVGLLHAAQLVEGVRC